MKKSISLLLILLACAASVRAAHIIGGEMFYEYLGSPAEGQHRYRVTLKLYRVCESSDPNAAEMPTHVYFTFFNKDNNQESGRNQSPRSSLNEVTLTNPDPCIVNPPRVCFQVGIYETTVTLRENNQGYVVAFQSCCRDYTIANLIDTHVQGDDSRPGNGSTYFAEIPGRTYAGNNSPVFAKDEAVLVCAGKPFTYDFSATDKDGDRLEYSFCEAYGGGKPTTNLGPGGPVIPDPAEAPPYPNVPYKSPYSGSQPLGAAATIDPQTGLITGTAPPPGKYVVTVCVNEYRGAQLVGTHRKDFHITVTTCTKLVTAAMPDKYADCDSRTVNFINNSTAGRTYFWDFGDGDTLRTTSTDPVSHTYAADGTYTAKLYVDRDSNCGDSATATVYVYPLLRADFTYSGLCATKPTVFTNTSTTSSGSDAINYYRWDFGDGASTADTSLLRTPPAYQYPAPGAYNVTLLVRTQQGCERSFSDTVNIYERPPLTASADTLMCYKDRLTLEASSPVNGTYAWTPSNYFITGANTATPEVNPQDDVTYQVTFTDDAGCQSTEDVRIDVRDTLLVRTGPDSTVCTGDLLHLQSTADGPYAFTWYYLDNNSEIGQNSDVYVTPPPPTAAYAVQVTLGSCTSRDTVNFTMVDPPDAYAGEDTTICYGDEVTLQASGGSTYRWEPASLVASPGNAVTTAKPLSTTDFIVTVTDVLGCPKPVTDTVQIGVVPPVPAFAGNDTIVIKDRPFQLHASGGVSYTWSPADGLSNPNVSDPVTTINRDFTYTVTVYSAEGCSGTDDIHLRFMTGPEIYIPTGFSPNGDGQNDVFRPLPVGIVKMDFFRVFDRWGKLMYSSTEYMKGWDGRVNGQTAEVGTYVWVVQGQDINGKTLLYKGAVTLLR